MNLVDFSGWLAFFAGTKNAVEFAVPLEMSNRLLVPTMVIYEVIKVLLRERGEDAAIIAQAHMQQGTVADLTVELATGAAAISLQNRIPMADSIILATALVFGATIWTRDEHFKGIPGIRYFRG